jgi:hypothetical protein
MDRLPPGPMNSPPPIDDGETAEFPTRVTFVRDTVQPYRNCRGTALAVGEFGHNAVSVTVDNARPPPLPPEDKDSELNCFRQ